MTDQDDMQTALAVIQSRLEDIKVDVAEIRQEQHNQLDRYVSRGEWTQRNITVDGRLNSLGKEVNDVRTEVRAKVQWPSVVAILISTGTLLWMVFGPTV